MMKIILLALLVAFATARVDDWEYVSKGLLRHRQLKCINKGFPCVEDNIDCCGKSICGEDKTCCLPSGVKGCDVDADCCGGSSCVDSMCGDGTTEGDGGRSCAIHGEECTNSNGSNTCCGSSKYLCEFVKVDEGDATDSSSATTQCCIPLGGKGCSYTSHCCGSLIGNICNDDSRCVEGSGDFPDDAPGGRDCGLKGDDCSVPSDCCGSQKYDCQDGTCCILTGLNGCGKDSDCCSGSCDLMLALCYEKLN